MTTSVTVSSNAELVRFSRGSLPAPRIVAVKAQTGPEHARRRACSDFLDDGCRGQWLDFAKAREKLYSKSSMHEELVGPWDLYRPARSAAADAGRRAAVRSVSSRGRAPRRRAAAPAAISESSVAHPIARLIDFDLPQRRAFQMRQEEPGTAFSSTEPARERGRGDDAFRSARVPAWPGICTSMRFFGFRNRAQRAISRRTMAISIGRDPARDPRRYRTNFSHVRSSQSATAARISSPDGTMLTPMPPEERPDRVPPR